MRSKRNDSFIPLSEPTLQGHEWDYVKKCLDSNWVSYLGPFVKKFEETLAKRLGVRYAIATNSGTAALHIALLVAGIKPDDEVLVPDLTFIAPVNAIRYCGAYPVFMDVDPTYWQLDSLKVADFLKNQCQKKKGQLINKKSGRLVRGILPVHILGHPCDMDPLMDLAKEYGLVVIEDAAESLGAKYKDRSVGRIGHIGCFSFNGNKIITTGGGGLLVTNNADWAARARYLTTQARDSVNDYIHHSIGYNYRLTNIQAALGMAQVEKLDFYIQVKRQIAKRYAEGFKGIRGLTLPCEAPWAFSTYWLYTLLVDSKLFSGGRHRLQTVLKKHRIQARPLWVPNHEQRPYWDCQTYRIEATPTLYRQALSLPSSVSLRKEDQQTIIHLIKHLMTKP